MNNDFLQTYKIPLNVVHNVTPALSTDAVGAVNIMDCIALSPIAVPTIETNNIDRFKPPGKHGTDYQPASLKRKCAANLTNGATPAKVKNVLKADAAEEGKLVMFYGRDQSYPYELNMLIKPLECELCRSKMNSQISAKDHYESKAHDKHLTQWLQKKYIDKGLSMPDIKRFHNAGPKGPEAFHCELCDIKLTSLAHAKQHYSGRKHRLVAENISKPSGLGYYDASGKWVRTGTKLSKVVCNDGRFGIGEQFLQLKAEEAAVNTETAAPIATVTAVNPSLSCQICNISVTSASQMETHVLGTKHRNKLKAASVDATISIPSATLPQTSLLAAALGESSSCDDYSMYRTPSGSYYCQTCNVSLCHISALQQHLVGKKHLKRAADEKAAAQAHIVEPKAIETT